MFDLDMIQKVYAAFPKKLEQIRQLIGRPLTLTEKILYLHVQELPSKPFAKGSSYVEFSPDRVAMQDATAQMAVLQFISAYLPRTQAPTTIHCDHLIQAEVGADLDLQRAKHESKEVYDFLESASRKYGIGFWPPGAGIIHQVVLENYAFPGGMMIGTDSHTPNAGGLGMIAVGVGGADAVDVMAGMAWEVKFPKIIGVKLTGKMNGWTSPKDVILKLAGILTVKGGTGYIIEYFGPGTESISCTGKGTICNMGAEIGATTSIFPYDKRMGDYLIATEREEVAKLTQSVIDCLTPDSEVVKHPDAYYDQIIDLNLDTLEPYVNGPYSPDKAWKISELKKAVKENGYPDKISVALIGSCTNSSYEDMTRAASIAVQAIKHGIKAKSSLTVTPGSEMIHSTILRDGLLDDLESIGGMVLANACGPCIGQWKRHDVAFGEKNSILTSYNRNFAGRNDANPGTHSFVTSPEMVIAMSLSGKMSFNPMTDPLYTEEGKEVYLEPPSGDELPKKGFTQGTFGYIAPAADGSKIQLVVDPKSERLQLLHPFSPRSQAEFNDLVVLMKAKGKCTTDHISPAGKWLKFRGHLDHISNNMFTGAVNAFREEIGKGLNQLSGEIEPFPQIARSYKEKKMGWIAVGDENYGEGSSREHAAMEPRFLGASAVLVKSFARIHETNLKKQGVLAITFANPSDYDKILENDRLFIDLKNFKVGQPLRVEIKHQEGEYDVIDVNHTFNASQMEWFWAGSALNLMKSH